MYDKEDFNRGFKKRLARGQSELEAIEETLKEVHEVKYRGFRKWAEHRPRVVKGFSIKVLPNIETFVDIIDFMGAKK